MPYSADDSKREQLFMTSLYIASSDLQRDKEHMHVLKDIQLQMEAVEAERAKLERERERNEAAVRELRAENDRADARMAEEARVRADEAKEKLIDKVRHSCAVRAKNISAAQERIDLYAAYYPDAYAQLPFDAYFVKNASCFDFELPSVCTVTDRTYVDWVKRGGYEEFKERVRSGKEAKLTFKDAVDYAMRREEQSKRRMAAEMSEPSARNVSDSSFEM